MFGTRGGRVAVCVVLAVAPLCVVTLQLAALRAAGLTGVAPQGGGVITTLISTLTSNWEWLIGTGVGMVLMIIAGLMIFGSQRAPDYLFKVIAGIMLILIVIPAVLA